jgi:hypothetical protein
MERKKSVAKVSIPDGCVFGRADREHCHIMTVCMKDAIAMNEPNKGT